MAQGGPGLTLRRVVHILHVSTPPCITIVAIRVVKPVVLCID
jgi:hypothetical protein